MIKLSFCLRRLPKLSLAEFQRYWFDHHAPLVAKHSRVLKIRRYVQLHTLDDPLNQAIRGSRNAPEMYDGVAELWFDSLDDLRAPQTQERLAAGQELLEDERKFIDLSHSPLFFGSERVVIG